MFLNITNIFKKIQLGINFIKASNLKKAGKYLEAIKLYEKMCEKDTAEKYYADIYNNLGWLNYNLAANLTNNKAIDNKEMEAYIEKAYIALDRAIEIDPRNCKAYYNRGKFNKNNKTYDLAIQDFTMAIKLGAAYCYNDRAFCFEKQSLFQEAFEDKLRDLEYKGGSNDCK